MPDSTRRGFLRGATGLLALLPFGRELLKETPTIPPAPVITELPVAEPVVLATRLGPLSVMSSSASVGFMPMEKWIAATYADELEAHQSLFAKLARRTGDV